MGTGLPKRIKISLLLPLLVLVVAACSQKQSGQGEDLLTLDKVIKAFKDSGLKIVEDNTIPGKKVELNGVRPSVFIIDGSQENRLFIYVFKTFDDRKTITETWNEQKRNIYQDYMNKDVPGPFKYRAKNILIVNTVGDIEEYDSQPLNLTEIVFEKLNNGTTIVCKGESENWEGTFTLKYYLHQWVNKEGVLQHDAENRLSHNLKYKPTDINSSGKISYEYKGPGHEGSGTDYLDETHRVISGSTGGNSYVPTENLVYYVTVKCNGKEEKFEARPINKKISI